MVLVDAEVCLNQLNLFVIALVVAGVAGIEAPAAWADGLQDNVATRVRPIPPIAKPLAPSDEEAIRSKLDALGRKIEGLRDALRHKPELRYLPDVQVYFDAVRYPLVYHETLDPVDAYKALADGMARAEALSAGHVPWIRQSGPRGYVSRIDGSVQPYRVIVPDDLQEKAQTGGSKKYRLDVWGHGRDEMLTELRFVVRDDPLPDLSYLKPYQQPRDKFVLCCYGRYINAFKFAGEMDGLEAMADVVRRYPIDENCVLIVGFSMGGASTWEYAVHYTDLWAAASPGAGFAETQEFLRVFQKEDVSGAPWYERTLYHLYDCTDYAANLFNLPTIAYGGELDPQKQASDIMLKATAAEGVKIERLVGPRTAHRYELATRQQLDRELDAILAKGRNPARPEVRLETWTLRYNRMYWITLDGLEHHWRRSRADAKFVTAPDGTTDGFSIRTQNATALTLHFDAGLCPVKPGQKPRIDLDGTSFTGPAVAADRTFTCHFARGDGKWEWVQGAPPAQSLRKQHGLQGPIDDAFMEPFIFVRPTGVALNSKCGAWEAAELAHATEHWRKQFRAEPIVKDDSQITDQDIATSNLVLFGDPSSNTVLARVADKLPIRWGIRVIQLGERSFSSDHHVPVLIYPNPLHPDHYVVLNSGFTYREYDYLNNARQTPKLPDYAILDVDVPRTSRSAGGVAAAGFFGESWNLLPDDGQSAVTIGNGSTGGP